MPEPTKWPERLREQTRETLDSHGLDMPVIPRSGMKNIDGRKGYIDIGDLIAGRFAIHDRRSEEEETFETAGDVLDSGWVID